MFQTYYRRYGYEVCTGNTIVEFPSKALIKYRHDVADARMIETLDDAMALSPLNQKFSSRYNMAVKQDAFSWKRKLRDDYQKAEGYRYALSKRGETVAYLFFFSLSRRRFRIGSCCFGISPMTDRPDCTRCWAFYTSCRPNTPACRWSCRRICRWTA